MIPLDIVKPNAVLERVMSLASAIKTHFLNLLLLLNPNRLTLLSNLILKPFFGKPAVWLPLTLMVPVLLERATLSGQLVMLSDISNSGLSLSVLLATVAKLAFGSFAS